MSRRVASLARRGDRGASSVEYGLVVFAIAASIALVVFALGPPVLGLYADSCTAIKGQVVQGSTGC